MADHIRVLCLVLLLPLLPLASASPAGDDVLEEFDIGRDAGPIVVPVTIQGKRYPFVVDTASSHSVFDTSLRPCLCNPVKAQHILTPAGLKQFAFAIPPDTFVGRLPLCKTAPVLVHDLQRLRETAGLDIKGFLGMDFLSQYVVRIDFDRGRLALLRAVGRDAGHPLAIKRVQGTPRVEADVMGAGPAVWFLIDTADFGSDSGRLTEGTFGLLKDFGKLTPAGESRAETGGGVMEVKQGRLECIKIGPFEHRGLCFGTTKDTEALGLGFWARYTVTFDFPANTMYLRANMRHGSADVVGGSGLGMVRREGRTFVECIADGSPAAKAGIRKGDEIVSIEGKKASEGSLLVLGRLLCGEGRTVRLVVRQGREVRKVPLRLETSWRTGKKNQ
jgi:hypothetical protein